MNKLLKNIFIILITALFAATALTGCDGMMSTNEDDSSSSSTMAYLSLSSFSGALESTAADAALAKSAARTTSTTTEEGDSTITSPDELTKVSVAKVVLKSNSTVAKYQTLGTWTSDNDATETSGNAILKLYADTSIAIPVDDDSGEATYTFSVELYDSEGILLGTGEEENVTVRSGEYTKLDFIVTLYGDGAIRIKNSFKTTDRVSKIEAGIFDLDENAISVSDTETLDYEELAVFTTDDGADQYAYYVAPQVPAGSYLYNVRVYGKQYSMLETDDDTQEGTAGTDNSLQEVTSDVILNTYSYVIQIDEGLTTYKNTLELSKINTLYKITYHLGNATWTESSSPSYSRNNCTATILPLGSSLYLNGYGFEGWYDNEDYSGSPVTVIAADVEENAKDMEFWAKWDKIEVKFAVVELHKSEAEDLSVNTHIYNNTTLIAQAQSDFDFDHYKWFVNNTYYPEYDDLQVASIYIQFFDGGTYDVTVHASKEGTNKDSSAQEKFTVTQLPDFPITYKNGTYLDFTTGEFTGKHESSYAPVFYYGGTTVLDVPTMDYYSFGGYYFESDITDDSTEISVISGTDYDDEITLYTKWNPKNPLNVTIPANSVQNFEKMSTGLNVNSSIYVFGNFDEKDQWYTYQFFSKAEDNLSAALRSNLYRTGSNYYGFYPASAISSYIDAESTETKITLDYSDQRLTDISDTLASHDFMTGKIEGTDLDSTLNFARLGEKLTFNLTGVTEGTTFKKMVLYVPDTYIPTVGYVDISAENPEFVCTEDIPDDKYNHFMMDLNITAVSTELAVSVMLPPFDASGKTVILTLIDSDGNYYNAYFNGYNYEAGTDYEHTAEADLNTLPQYVTIGGKKVSTYNYGAYSPEDYGNLYSAAETAEFNITSGSIPAKADWAAIAENSDITAEVAIVHGVNGIKFTATDGTELFVPANGYSSSDGSNIVRTTEVNLWTKTTTGDYTYTLYASSDDDENGVMAYSNTEGFSYGHRLFY